MHVAGNTKINIASLAKQGLHFLVVEKDAQTLVVLEVKIAFQ